MGKGAFPDAPTDGSAPNLVGQKVDEKGVVHDVREFNTQTCEQLNAWLGGFESILKWMISKNFNWFMHVMLFYHIKHVLAKLSVPPVADNQDDHHNDNNSQSGSSSEEKPDSTNDVESTSSGENDVGLSSDENGDDNDTENTTTNSNDEVLIGDTNDDMVEDKGDEEDEEDEEDEHQQNTSLLGGTCHSLGSNPS